MGAMASVGSRQGTICQHSAAAGSDLYGESVVWTYKGVSGQISQRGQGAKPLVTLFRGLRPPKADDTFIIRISLYFALDHDCHIRWETKTVK